MSGQALAIHDVTSVIHPHRVKHTFGDIDSEDVHLLLPWTRLLWLNGFTDLELIVAHGSRSAQGRVHFITTEGGIHGHEATAKRCMSLQAMRPATARRYAAPPPDFTRYKV